MDVDEYERFGEIIRIIDFLINQQKEEIFSNMYVSQDILDGWSNRLDYLKKRRAGVLKERAKVAPRKGIRYYLSLF